MRFPQATLLISCLVFANPFAFSQPTEIAGEEGISPVISTTQPDRRAAWESLIVADKAFAREVRELGRTQAFLNRLGEGSVRFTSNGPIDARDFYLKRLQNPSRQVPDTQQLTWTNQYNDVSVSGDLAVTVGPWLSITGSFEEQHNTNGYLVSVWRKISNEWRVMAVMAVNIPGVLGLDVEPDYSATQQVYDEVGDSILDLVADAGPLIDAEMVFGRSIDARGGRRAILRRGLENQRVYLPGMAPAFGNVEGSYVYGQYLDRELSTNSVTINSMGGYIAKSGEMGYTYGTMETSREHGFHVNYLRVWRVTQDGDWKIAVEALDDPG